MGLEIIDPNDINFATVPEYEKGFIFADLVATRRGNTNLGTANQESVTVSFLGYDQRKGREGDFSTRYSYLGLDEVKDNTHEGFGITNIKIETNSSYVPKVVIEMVDIRGATLFNKGASSPYAILMDFPPPLFELTVKGYYGKPLAYKLHLVRQNSVFNSENGNMTITAEFIASTYGILADIPIGYLLTMPFMDKNYDITSLENSTFPANTFELIYKFKSLFEKIDNIQNGAEITKTEAAASVGLENVDAYYEMMNGVTEDGVKRYSVGGENPDVILIRLSKEYDDKEIADKIVEKEKIVNNIREKITTDKTDNGDKSLFKDFDVNTITVNGSNKTIGGIIGGIIAGTKTALAIALEAAKKKIKEGVTVENAEVRPEVTPEIPAVVVDKHTDITIDFTTLVAKLATTKTELDGVKTDNENKIAGEAEKVSVALFGEQKPTVGKIFEILCKDIDTFMGKINGIGREADTHHETNKAEIIKVASGYANMGLHNNSKIYPFPTITSTENNGKDGKAPRVRSKGYIGQLFKDFNPEFPEYKFVEDFIQATLDKAKKEESFDKQDGVNEKTDEAFWLPMSPMAVGFDGKLSKCPYVGKTTGQELINVYIARITAILGYVFGVNKTIPNILKRENTNNIIDAIIKIEAENMFTLIDNDTIFESLSTNLETYINEAKKTILLSPVTEIDLTKFGSEKELYDSFFLTATGKTIGLVDEVSDTIDVSLTKPYTSDNFSDKSNILKELDNVKAISLFGFSIDIGTKIEYIVNSRGTLFLADKKEPTKFGLADSNFFYNRTFDRLYNKIFQNILCKYIDINSLANQGAFLTVNYVENDKKRIIRKCCEFFDNFDDNMLAVFQNSSILELPPIILVIIGGAIQPNEDGTQRSLSYTLSSLSFASPTPGSSVIEATIGSSVDSVTKKYFDRFITDLDTFRVDNPQYSNQDQFNNQTFDGAFEINNIIPKSEIDKFKSSRLYKEYFEKKVYYKINSANLYRDRQVVNSANVVNCFFVEDVNTIIINAIKDRKKTVEKKAQEEKASVERKFENADVKQKLYQSFKSLYERWCEGRNISGGFEEFGSSLFSSFKFVDRAYNDISNECYISVKPLLNFENTPDSSMYSVISSLLSYNSFEFFPLQNFLEFTTDAWKEVFTIHDSQTILDAVKARPQFTCMYMGGTSSVLENDLGRYKNDGFSLEDAPMEDFQTGSAKAFKVSWAKQNQSIFKSIQLSTTEHRETNESLKILASISKDDSNTTPEPVGQNLFPIHEQRSYSCTVEMMGNVMIQPVQYFELKNIPMYSGAYMILDVTHTIIPNSMTTSFKGVKVAKFPNPLITNFLASNGIVGGTGGGQGGGQSDGEFFEGLGGATVSHPLGSEYIKGASVQDTSKIGLTSGFYRSTGVFHGGGDYAGIKGDGSPIYAVADGVVQLVTDIPGGQGYGNFVRITHSGGYITAYAHMLKKSELKMGAKILQGELIGYQGNTGMSSGSHLHFELKKNTTPLDTVPYILGKSTLNGLFSEKPNRSAMGGNSTVNGDFMVGNIPFSQYFTELQKKKITYKDKPLFQHKLNITNFQKWAGNSEKWSGRSKLTLNEFIGVFTIVYNETGGLFLSIAEQGGVSYIESASSTKLSYGYKERGRGFIQVTTKANYEVVLKDLGLKSFDKYDGKELDDLFLNDDKVAYGALKVYFNNSRLGKNGFDGLLKGDFYKFGLSIAGGNATDYAKFYEHRVKTIFEGIPKNTTLENKSGNSSDLKAGKKVVTIGGVSVTIVSPAVKTTKNIIALQGWGQTEDFFWLDKTDLAEKATKAGYRLIVPNVKNTGYASQDFPETTPSQKSQLKREWFTKTLIEGLRKDYGIFGNEERNFILGLSTGARGVALIVMDKPVVFEGCAVLSGDYDQLVYADGFMSQIYGSKAQNAQRWKSIDNIITQISRWRTPVYIGHGGSDTLIPKSQSQTLYNTLKKTKPNLQMEINIASGQIHDAKYWKSEIDNMLKFFENINSEQSI